MAYLVVGLAILFDPGRPLPFTLWTLVGTALLAVLVFFLTLAMLEPELFAARQAHFTLAVLAVLLLFSPVVAFASPPNQPLVILGVWLVIMAAVAFTTAHAFRTSPTQHRRRQAKIWTFVLALSATADLANIAAHMLPDSAWPFSFLTHAGYLTRFLGVLLAVYVVLAPQFPRQHYVFNRTLREYSQSISNILDPELLTTVAVGLINEAMEIQRGYLFLVDSEMGDHGEHIYHLKGTRGMGEGKPSPGFIGNDSPVARWLSEEGRYLTQQDLNSKAEFKLLSPEERSWFNSLKADIYIPIHVKEGWIGLLALGPKVSGAPFTSGDIELLTVLGDQTAVAMQNARLVEGLTRLNHDFRRAYSGLERANYQLERLDRTKSDFISISSHELRTPLAVIRGYTEILREEPLVAENPYHLKLVNGIHSGILRLHEIVDAMLDMASIDTRSLELHTEPVHMYVLIRLVTEGYKKAAEERRLNIIVDDLRHLPPVEADSEALRKVFNHLISNAVKFTPDGGSVTISGQAVTGGTRNLPDGGIEICITDTGIGISPEFQELIFTKFYQTSKLDLHSTGKTKFKGAGAGLGLSIAKGIIEAHGGKITVESPGYDEDKCPGSTFKLLLPLKR